MSGDTFASTLREFRERAGLTPTQLAAATMLDKSTITRFESGARMPSRMTLRVLALALGLDVDERDYARFEVAAGYWPGERGALLVLDDAGAIARYLNGLFGEVIVARDEAASAALDALATARAAGIGNKWG